ncbi:sensor histidine kinase [Biformimicrobium ophioploci]|uniref:Histidine kinase/HSP90-like ATPase domain-containing protein n=1 Tax=Biformimicrobium ophioploci TaxID=3036711 RepID=A0ABQ6LUK3_9GAMM|nr:histidine kinase [Microbulbifer sp. NKW57]GMG85766.1 hypothetical protein MNKW57_00870 [Microbulbifer sp. NKW57]
MSSRLFQYASARLEDPKRQYRAFQLLGWSGYGFATYIGGHFWVDDHLAQALYMLVATITGWLLTIPMRRIYLRLWNREPLRRVIGTLLAITLAALLWALLKKLGNVWAFPEEGGLKWGDSFYWYAYSFMIYVTWTGAYFAIKYYRASREEREKALRAESMAHQAQLKMLRYQLNPHFLFNTLNAISTLILDKDSPTANAMVTRLSQFLRHSLDNDPMQKVTLEKEVEALMLYLDIEKVRFGERLQVDVRMDDAAQYALVPSLLLQPMVENAIKYAISRREEGGSIRIEARVISGELHLAVSDSGSGEPVVNLSNLEGSSGVGVRNTRERLQVLYGKEQDIRFTASDLGGLAVRIRLPYETVRKKVALHS